MTQVQSQAQRQIDYNVAIHDKLAGRYETEHGEIFNEVEQERLRFALARARAAITSGDPPLKAFDFGCGSGNLSKHLIQLGFEVTAADVSSQFLQLVAKRFAGEKIATFLINGTDLSEIADSSFDLVGAYSVLHHIPDYLAAIEEMARVCKAGGVLVLDHEKTEEFWTGSSLYDEFRKAALLPDFRKFLRPSNYVHKVWRMIHPRHTNEGDIHVFPDDHIEWTRIRNLLAQLGFEVVIEENYLLYRRLYRRDVYDRYKDRCSDTKLMAFRRASS